MYGTWSIAARPAGCCGMSPAPVHLEVQRKRRGRRKKADIAADIEARKTGPTSMSDCCRNRTCTWRPSADSRQSSRTDLRANRLTWYLQNSLTERLHDSSKLKVIETDREVVT